MINRLRAASTATATENHDPDHLLTLCHNSNVWARRIGLRQWHYVEPNTPSGQPQCRQVEGTQCEEVWTIMDGKQIAYHNWPQEKLDPLVRKARWLFKQGYRRD